MSQRKEKRFRQLERRVSILETQVKNTREEMLLRDIEDAQWDLAANAATVRWDRNLLQRIRRAWMAWRS